MGTMEALGQFLRSMLGVQLPNISMTHNLYHFEHRKLSRLLALYRQ